VLTQVALLDAILEVVGVRQGGDEVQAGGDVDPRLVTVAGMRSRRKYEEI
jgi:hypothetical protein